MLKEVAHQVGVRNIWNMSQFTRFCRQKRGDKDWKGSILGATNDNLTLERGAPDKLEILGHKRLQILSGELPETIVSGLVGL
jgi:hypothetical protein